MPDVFDFAKQVVFLARPNSHCSGRETTEPPLIKAVFSRR